MTAAPGEQNRLVVTLTDAIRVADSAPLEAGEGCREEPDGGVACDRPASTGLVAFVNAGDQDDEVRFDIGSEPGQLYIDGGEGDDLLAGGGTGLNYFTGGVGNDRMIGAGGANEFLEGATANGSDQFEGGHGQYDSVRYDARRRGVRVTLDGEANDGEPGEHDFISPSVTSIYGGGGPDVLVGSAAPDGLVGNGGADVLRGRGGNDGIVSGNRLYGRIGSDDRLYGGAGDDSLGGNAGDDLIVGGPGRDYLQAYSGADRVLPGPGRDRVRTGPAGDFVDARDRMVDTVACGTGRDRVRNDRIDLISASCDLSSNRINYRSLTAEFGCTAQPDGSVFCPEAGARVKVDAGDLDDQILGNLGVVGGAGRDTLVGNDEGSSSRAWTVAM